MIGFFWLSGLLGAFTLYRNVSKIGGGDVSRINRSCHAWITMSYWARYLRLVPIMMFLVLIEMNIVDQLPSGSTTIERGKWNAACSDDWWRLLLLIQNLTPAYYQEPSSDDGPTPNCMGHLCMFMYVHSVSYRL